METTDSLECTTDCPDSQGMISTERDRESTGFRMRAHSLGYALIDLTDESRSLDDARRRILLNRDLFELVMPAEFDLPAEFFDLVD